LLLAVFGFLGRAEDLVCVGLVCAQWHAVSLEPSLWRRLCASNLARVASLSNPSARTNHVDTDTDVDVAQVEEGVEKKMMMKKRKKVEKMKKKAMEEEEQELQQRAGVEVKKRKMKDWRACYAKHHWE
jgi:hypothetical protein